MNINEIAAKLAEFDLMNQWQKNNKEKPLLVQQKNGDFNYNVKAQEIFTNFYTYYFNKLEEMKNTIKLEIREEQKNIQEKDVKCLLTVCEAYFDTKTMTKANLYFLELIKTLKNIHSPISNFWTEFRKEKIKF